ncbi:germination lipoprotein GerS [Tepidibacter formicigenes]|uniref:Outer membrane lipoprotein-sorting protein n=1 Tax=Tepidibacter formicigenes DSM 15518 TaxID=1123349 RepID=A0A1M6MRS4_9FIRM|nr:germination lipoprotein GerS [Tepidibacter formicigenes]SHJ86099.1 Outer membrane lipoprotein-sorting protein [Tepidibacter formicigenes DSM 15518]
MKKWILYALLSFVLVFSLTGCRESTNEEVYYKFHKKIANLKSYSCIAYINVSGNKSAKEYIVKHYYKTPDYYKLETLSPSNLKGKTTIYDKDKIIIKKPKYKDEFKITYKGIENRYLFVGDFIQNIFENENLNISGDRYFLILETDIPGSSFYFNKEKVYIDKKTLKPNKLEIMDSNGKKRFTVTYKEFRYNID